MSYSENDEYYTFINCDHIHPYQCNCRYCMYYPMFETTDGNYLIYCGGMCTRMRLDNG